MRLFILGIPGSGKGTISKLLVDFFYGELKHFNVGEILRNRADNDSHIKETHAAGGLVNSDRVLSIFDEALEEDWFIADGSPRRPEEAQYVLNHPSWKADPGYLIHLDLDLSIARERLNARNRFDDSPEVINRRFEEFFTHTMKSIKAFEQEDRLVTINANQDPKAVCYDILQFLINNQDLTLEPLSEQEMKTILKESSIE